VAVEGTLLFVADTAANRIAAVPHPLDRTTPKGEGGSTVSKGGELGEPLAMALAPNGNILTTNSGNGNIVETTETGKQFTYNTHVAPDELFGLTLTPDRRGILFVNDSANNVEIAH
jgi:sugar lactone lactonase YvrE